MKQVIIYLVILFFDTSHAQTNKKSFNAFNKSLTIIVQNDSISAYALLAKGKEKKQTVILLHGLPGNEKNLDLAENLRQNGKNVIYFNYRGSWGSQGDFLYSNCLNDISKVVDYISEDSISINLRINTDNIVLIGHSLGGGIAILYGINDKRIKKIISLSTYNAGGEFKLFKSIDELNNFKTYLDKQFMLNINSKRFISEIIDNKEQWDIGNMPLNNNKQFLLIDENNRNEWWIRKMSNIEYIIIKSDHSFSDKRKELSNIIIKWLSKN